MPKGDWRGYPAIGVAIFAVIGGLTAVTLQQPEQVQTRPREKCSEEQLRAPGSRCFVPQAAQAYPAPYSDEWQRQKDLEAQQAMAFFAGLMFVVTGLGVWYVSQTLNATREAIEATNLATDETRQIGRAQVRAYLLLARVGFRVTNKRVVARYMVRNSGQSPARRVRIELSKAAFEWRNGGETKRCTAALFESSEPLGPDVGAGVEEAFHHAYMPELGVGPGLTEMRLIQLTYLAIIIEGRLLYRDIFNVDQSEAPFEVAVALDRTGREVFTDPVTWGIGKISMAGIRSGRYQD